MSTESCTQLPARKGGDMSQIENAAREIAFHIFGYCDKNHDVHAAELEPIIRRHLFPVVKFEDVDRSEMYYVRYAGNPNWEFIRGRFLVSDDEIRGPVPPVEKAHVLPR
jgi:hypothetical protein